MVTFASCTCDTVFGQARVALPPLALGAGASGSTALDHACQELVRRQLLPQASGELLLCGLGADASARIVHSPARLVYGRLSLPQQAYGATGAALVRPHQRGLLIGLFVIAFTSCTRDRVSSSKPTARGHCLLLS